MTMTSPRVTTTTNANIAQLLWNAAARNAGHCAILSREEQVDYATLRERTVALAHALTESGVNAGDRVAILVDSGSDAVAAYFATLAIGGVAVVVNAVLRPRQIEYVIRHVVASVIVTSADLLARQPRAIHTSARVVDVGQVPASRTERLEPVIRADSDLAQIVMTSGSTGLPKGVMISHANLWAATRTVVDYLRLSERDRIASVLPLSFVYGLSQLLCSTMAGATLVIERSPLVHQIVDTVRRENVTVLAAVPSLWARILREQGFTGAPIESLRVITNAGGHLPVTAVRALRQVQPDARLYLMYGFTEVLRSTYLAPEEVDRRPDSIGRPLRGATIDVVREDGKPAEPGEPGELVHRGPTVTLGYWNDPVRTTRTFRAVQVSHAHGTPERAVHSGDIVTRDAEGFLYFVGRKDRIIKTLGYRVGPDEVADALYDSGEVAEAVIFGEPDEERGERIVAHVVLAPGASLTNLQEFCERELPPYLQPSRIDVHDELPHLDNGKPDERPELYVGHP